jgi:hypothetical protein
LKIVGEVVHVVDVTFELEYVTVRSVAGMLFLFQTFLFLFYFIMFW